MNQCAYQNNRKRITIALSQIQAFAEMVNAVLEDYWKGTVFDSTEKPAYLLLSLCSDCTGADLFDTKQRSLTYKRTVDK